jgi:hypothetical protein
MTATLTTLVSFFNSDGLGDGAIDGQSPSGDLIADSHGDLFGTTSEGGPGVVGTVFEIVKTAGGYASTPTTLATFNVYDGSEPVAGLRSRKRPKALKPFARVTPSSAPDSPATTPGRRRSDAMGRHAGGGDRLPGGRAEPEAPSVLSPRSCDLALHSLRVKSERRSDAHRVGIEPAQSTGIAARR